MESLQFVGCSWFIGLIGLVSDSPEIKATENRTCVHTCPSPVSSRPHLDAPGVHSVAPHTNGARQIPVRFSEVFTRTLPEILGNRCVRVWVCVWFIGAY
jgi:hypothetical protein